MSWHWQVGPASGGGGTAQKIAALQPLVARSGVLAKAAWAPLRNPATNQPLLADRTGHGWDLGVPATSGFTKDLIPNQAAYVPCIGYPYATGLLGQTVGPGPVMKGSCSITARCMRMTGGTGSVAWIYHCGFYDGEPSTMSLITCAAGADQIFSNWNNGVEVNAIAPTLKMPPDAQWHFVSVVRTVVPGAPLTATVRFGLDGVFENAPGTYVLPVAGDGGRFSIMGCQGAIPAGSKGNGPAADIVLWDGAITDADVLALRATAMGL